MRRRESSPLALVVVIVATVHLGVSFGFELAAFIVRVTVLAVISLLLCIVSLVACNLVLVALVILQQNLQRYSTLTAGVGEVDAVLEVLP
jgi:hypothetical protein